jgi:hypothetical protein
MTTVGVSGSDFTIDGTPTYAGRSFEGRRIEGLLCNVRAVQATFDDANPETRQRWAYPDTGRWDPERNVTELCAALPSWRDHGVLAFTVNFQGGGPNYEPSVYSSYDNNAFTPAGDLKPDYADRMRQVLATADDLGMVAIVGLFYVAQIKRFEDDAAMWRAASQALDVLAGTGRRNVIVEFANEIEVIHTHTGNDRYAPERAGELIRRLRSLHPGFLYTISHCGPNPDTGRGIPVPGLIAAEDVVCIHGNGVKEDRLARTIDAVKAIPAYRENPKPILINEDSPAVANFDVAWRRGVSWGYYDQGYGSAWKGDAWVDFNARPRETLYEDLSGFQTPPISWTINTDHKRAFFRRVAEVTGVGS